MESDKERITDSGEAVQDPELAEIRSKLESWKELVLQVDDVLLWRKPKLLCAAIGMITATFLLVWFLEPSVLTQLGMLGLLLSLVDFATPAIASKLLSSGEWSGEQERHFEAVTLRLLQVKKFSCKAWDTLVSWKVYKPALYLAVTVGSLSAVAWLGSCVNNLWLTYIATVVSIVTPGLLHHNIVEKYSQQVRSRVRSLLSQAKEPKKQE